MPAKKSIALLFTGLLLVILGHDIVPHHHHANHFHPCQDYHHHHAWTDTFRNVDLSGCCHAFNGIEYFPTPEKQDISKPYKAAKYICLSQVIELHLASFDQEFFRSSRCSPPVFTYLLGSSTGLRAPPHLV